MMSRLFFLNYNNYFNRQVKYEEDLSAYLEYYPLLQGFNKVNFNPNNGIYTQHVLNWPTDIQLPDYLLVCDEITDEIKSRWFVIEAVRTLVGQYQLSLKRDLLVDYSGIIKSSPCFIERAWIPVGNRLIYNTENSLVNQIKKKELLLTDETRCPWIVGYVAENAWTTGNGGVADIKVDSSLSQTQFDNSLNSAVDSEYTYSELTAMASKKIGTISNLTYACDFWTDAFIGKNIHHFYIGNRVEYQENQGTYISGMARIGAYYVGSMGQQTAQSANTKLNEIYTWQTDAINGIKYAIGADYKILTPEERQWFVDHQGKLLKDEDGNFFTISISFSGGEARSLTLDQGYGVAFYNPLTAFESYTTPPEGGTTAGVYLDYTLDTINIGFQTVDLKAFTCTLKSESNRLKDAPYRMFCIPYPMKKFDGGIAFTQKYKEQSGTITLYEYPNQEASINLAMSIAMKLGSKLYDLQLLPYCPVRYLGFDTSDRENFTNVHCLDLKNYLNVDPSIQNESEIYNAGTDLNTIQPVWEWQQMTTLTGRQRLLTYVIWSDRSNTSFQISEDNKLRVYGTPESDYKFESMFNVPSDPLDFKVKHETEFLRLTSPNYNGVFEFKSTSNDGISYFDVDYTYKPFQPYIHIAPNFGGLYGSDFDDARGLVLGGDFSLPTLTDNWQQYEINNKAYELSFKAQITNMENTYNIQREQAQTAGVINAITTGISGAGTGAMVGSIGGAPGMAIGAAIGGTSGMIASTIGMQKDLEYQDRLFKENKRYAEESWNISLQNIKALPYSLNKVGAFNKNNKMFPFLEFYDCTEEEKKAVRERLKWQSFSVNAISSIENFLWTERHWLQGNMVQLPDLQEDFELANAISSEVRTGIYI